MNVILQYNYSFKLPHSSLSMEIMGNIEAFQLKCRRKEALDLATCDPRLIEGYIEEGLLDETDRKEIWKDHFSNCRNDPNLPAQLEKRFRQGVIEFDFYNKRWYQYYYERGHTNTRISFEGDETGVLEISDGHSYFYGPMYDDESSEKGREIEVLCRDHQDKVDYIHKSKDIRKSAMAFELAERFEEEKWEMKEPWKNYSASFLERLKKRGFTIPTRLEELFDKKGVEYLGGATQWIVNDFRDGFWNFIEEFHPEIYQEIEGRRAAREERIESERQEKWEKEKEIIMKSVGATSWDQVGIDQGRYENYYYLK